jgi:ornithine cyclodeaminase
VARVLARPDSAVLAIIGAGRLALAHARAFAQMYRLTEVRIVSRSPESAARAARVLADDVQADVLAVKTAKKATQDADLIVTATSASNPVLHGGWVAEGAHVCAVGAAAPNRRELDTTVLERAAVIVTDTLPGALEEAGDLIVPIKAGRLDPARICQAGEVLLDPERGRRSDDQITVFKGIGSAVLDAAAASMLYERAVATGVGLKVSLT